MIITSDDLLQFSKAELFNKVHVNSDHSAIKWTLTSQPYRPIDLNECISRCKFCSDILNNPQITIDIY